MSTQTLIQLKRDVAVFSTATIVVALAACAFDPSAPSQRQEPVVSLGKAVSEVTVSSVKPDSATQDTTLDVVINGGGFISGSVASWALAGVQDPSQVRTNSTRYVSARQLIANITISSTATVGKWDVVVMAGSKGGIGTEAFAIKQGRNMDTNSRVNLVFDASLNVAPPGEMAVIAPSGIQGDARDKNGTAAGFSEYQGNFCGVTSRIFWSGTNFSGDLTFDADMDYNVAHSCNGLARTLNFYLAYQPGGSLGAAHSVGTFTNIRQVMQMGPGETRSQKTHFNYLGLSDCNRLDFDAAWAGASNVTVTRLPDENGARRWRVESQYPHMAMCTVSKGQNYLAKNLKYLPFAFTATEIPYPYPVYP